jgi:hypothetical protein
VVWDENMTSDYVYIIRNGALPIGTYNGTSLVNNVLSRLIYTGLLAMAREACHSHRQETRCPAASNHHFFPRRSFYFFASVR